MSVDAFRLGAARCGGADFGDVTWLACPDEAAPGRAKSGGVDDSDSLAEAEASAE